MRVAIIAESFLPVVNGVVNSVLRVLEHLRAQGHEALVIAPGARDGKEEILHYEGYRIVRVPTVEVPMVNSLPIGVPLPIMARTLQKFRPDVVHLASPFVLGGVGAFAAKMLGLPAVAVYQTDVAGFAKNYHLKALSSAAWQWTKTLHNQCALTLAPSSPTIKELVEHEVKNVYHWGRGVDTKRFNPEKRSEELRRQWGISEGEIVVGYVGRLAAEKSVKRLRALADRPGIRIVIVGDGPERAALEAEIPGAIFTGGMYGEDLSVAYASMDIFVHTGEFETFCQVIQEAQASGVPTIAPAAGGPLDLIDNGVNGFLLDVPTFEKKLPAAVDSIAASLFLYKKQAWVGVQNKTWSCLGDQLLKYYEQAIEIYDTQRHKGGLISS